MRISDWSSDVCSSDLCTSKWHGGRHRPPFYTLAEKSRMKPNDKGSMHLGLFLKATGHHIAAWHHPGVALDAPRSEEHTSELQSLMRISYAVFCLKKKNTKKSIHTTTIY